MRSNSSENRVQGGVHIVGNDLCALASVYGSFDLDSSPKVRDRLLALLQEQRLTKVMVDVSAVTHIDSAGVATLIEALRMARGRRTELRLQGLNDRLFQLFEFAGVLSLFNVSTRA